MIVCIAEKPSVGKEIARVLGANTQHDGYMEGNGYQVTWTFGHLCELKQPEQYTDDWKSWRMDRLPMVPEPFAITLKSDAGVRKQFKVIEKLFKKATSIINCGDAGMEGELIQRWVMQHANVRCPVQRLWISSLTETAIREGFRNLRPQNDFNNLYLAGLSRSVGDWLLGMNCTRLYSLKYGDHQVLSIGRVQTPTLALIVNRDREIAHFKPEPYWVLTTVYRSVTFTATHGSYKNRTEGEKEFESIRNLPFSVTKVDKKKGAEKSKQLYDLTALQVDCNRKYGMSAEQTLNTLQGLYEKKLTTYPRVDTRYLSDDIYPKCPGILSSLMGYEGLTAPLSGCILPKSRLVFDSGKVTDHHAIIPTGVAPSGLSDKEQKVYDAIAKRFISVFYPDCQYATTTVLGKVGTTEFKVSGKEILSLGWRQVYSQKDEVDDNGREDDQVLPSFIVGESGSHQPKLSEKMTLPPKHFTEASLLQAMETAGRLVDDETLKAALKENGIGRPSTRAAIIETLFKRRYIARDKKNILATQTGIQLIDIIKIDLLKSCELTGIWEKKLRDIEHGRYDSRQFVQELKAQLFDIVSKVKGDTSGLRIAAASLPVKTRSGSKVRATISRQNTRPSTSSARQPSATMRNSPSRTLKKVGVGDKCPLCGKGVVRQGKWGFYCDQYRSGCQFRQKQ